VTYRQYQTESAGRLLDFHERYQEREMKTYWNDIAEIFPELANEAQRELRWLNDLTGERTGSKSEPDLDKLITGLEPGERDLHMVVKQDLAQLEKEGFVLPDDDKLDNTQQQELEKVREIFLAAYDGKQWDWVAEPTPLRDQRPLINPLESTRTFESVPLSEISQSNVHERQRGEDPHTREERSR
jgi:hypothetical protein